jgi:cation transport protein ChaC
MQQFWIFGYGSLMWRPGFEHIASEPALIRGYHRKLCVYSHVHRGTPERPGLVLGLDRGGSCHGMAYRIDPSRWDETMAYLRAREQVTMVYIEKRSTIRLLNSKRATEAITYVVDRGHRQYAGALAEGDLVSHVRHGEGVSGHCIDYVMNTVSHLREMKIHDDTLERLAQRLQTPAISSSI